MKKQKVRSFAGRLTRRIVLVLLIVMGLTAFWLFLLAGSFAQTEEIDRHEALLKATAENLGRVVSDVHVAVRNQVPEIEESLDRPDRLMKLVERTVAQNPRIRSCGISFVEGFYPGKGRYMPYAIRRDSSTIEVLDFSSEREDYFHEDWFLEALKAKKGFWSEPFFENNDTILPLVAYMHPIRDKQGRAVAVVGADLSLDWLRDKMESADWKIYSQQWGGRTHERKESRKVARKPYSMLISKQGRFIVHPDEKRIIRDSIGSIVKASKDTVVVKFVQHILEGEASADIYKEDDNYDYECERFDGRAGYVFYRPIKHTGWSLVMFTPRRSIDLIAYVIGGCMTFFVLLAVLIVWLVSRFSIKRTARPLKQLAVSADEVANGNFEAPLPNIKHNDEIRNLRDSFEDMQKSLTKYMSELQTTTASKAAIENELKVAHDIQMAMLPKIFPPYPERDDIDIYGILKPAKDVGGDLFDFYIRDEKMFFCIGDVSGKGVPASLVMAVTRSLFRNISAHTAEPDQIVTALNEALTDGNDANMFVTAFIGVLDLSNGHLCYCNAGHDAPLLVGHQVGLVPCLPNLPLGVMPGYQYSLQKLTIECETTIFLFTDGLNEAEDINHVQFGNQRVLNLAGQLLAEEKHQPKSIVEKMDEALQSFVGEAEQSDDLTMLAIQYLKNHGE